MLQGCRQQSAPALGAASTGDLKAVPSLPAAEVLEIMRQSIESRKTALVELALDLIQRLIAHRALAGRVHSINHRRDLGGKSKRRGGDEDEEEGVPEEGGQLPPQARQLTCTPRAKRFAAGLQVLRPCLGGRCRMLAQ
jgi:hypothetical protein